jgi:hypothetical protein
MFDHKRWRVKQAIGLRLYGMRDFDNVFVRVGVKATEKSAKNIEG